MQNTNKKALGIIMSLHEIMAMRYMHRYTMKLMAVTTQWSPLLLWLFEASFHCFTKRDVQKRTAKGHET